MAGSDCGYGTCMTTAPHDDDHDHVDDDTDHDQDSEPPTADGKEPDVSQFDPETAEPGADPDPDPAEL
ncbi:MAG: hypothetical protein JWN22_1056 [Nocardioides sp.]|nr:hypothetical protein [Nocardioides sp.]